LNVDVSEVESLLVACILDRYSIILLTSRVKFSKRLAARLNFSTIQGRIDQVNQVLELNQQRQGTARYNALDNWTNQLSSLHLAIANKMA